MLSVNSLGGVPPLPSSGLAGRLADKLFADATGVFGNVDAATLGSDLDRLVEQDTDLWAAVRQELTQRLPVTEQAALQTSD